VIKQIESLTKSKYDENVFFDKQSPQFLINKDFKIIADHIKACTFAIADGALPSGKDRGYVLRKLIRRAMVSAKRLGIDKGFSSSVAKVVIKTMSHSYPYLLKEENNIVIVLEKEESLFLATLSKGYELFENSIKNKTIDTETLFKLVDTYGFPFKIISELAETKKVKLDTESFNKRFKKHQEISKSSVDIKGMVSQNADLISLKVKSIFDYDHLEMKHVKVVACFDENFKSINELDGKG
jgi:alanyl-tRNA synthetase